MGVQWIPYFENSFILPTYTTNNPLPYLL